MKKDDIKRAQLKCNTICNCILRVDFIKIEKMDVVLEKMVEYMKGKGYSFSTTDVLNVDITITDTDTLVTQEMLKRNINKTINNEFNNIDSKFILNEYVLIFEKKIFSDYSGIDKYFEIFKDMLNIIIKEQADIKIMRIGLRKINNIFTDEKFNLNDLFDKNVIPTLNGKNLKEYQIIKKIDMEDESLSNTIIYIQKGKGNYKNRDVDLFRFVWDIDCYLRNDKLNNSLDELNNDLIKLNNNVFKLHKEILSENFVNNMLLKDYKEDGKMGGHMIYAGINRNI